MALVCFECGLPIEAAAERLGDEFLAHARAHHEWPYSDQAIRNFAEATLRLTGEVERHDAIGPIEVHPVTEDRLDDWLTFFDHDAFVGKPEWAACYCFEPHVGVPEDPAADAPLPADPHWRENRAGMLDRLRSGGAHGYLAYADGRPVGWVNASWRSDYALYRLVDPGGPPAGDVIGVSCFVVAPTHRRHGVAEALLDRVLVDASARGASWVEAYPRAENDETGDDAGQFRGPRSMYDARGFRSVEVGDRYSVVRRPV